MILTESVYIVCQSLSPAVHRIFEPSYGERTIPDTKEFIGKWSEISFPRVLLLLAYAIS